MGDYTFRLGMHKPSLSDIENVEADVNTPADIMDLNIPMRVVEEDRYTIQNPFEGMMAYEKKKRRICVFANGLWNEVTSEMSQQGIKGYTKITANTANTAGTANLLLMSQTITYEARRNVMIEADFNLEAVSTAGGTPSRSILIGTTVDGGAPSAGGAQFYNKDIAFAETSIKHYSVKCAYWQSTDATKTIGFYLASTNGGNTFRMKADNSPAKIIIRDIGAEINYAP